MAKWKQVDGDRDFSGVGCVLANDEGSYIELVRITPWLEMDSSALKEGYSLWDISTATFDLDNLDPKKKTVQDAMKTVGLSREDYDELEPSYRAAVLASHEGYEDSTSTNDFAKALPAPIDQIEFYAGQAKPDDIAEINSSMRREATQKLYGGSRKKVPTLEALEFALGEDETLTIPLDENEAQAVRFTTALETETNTGEFSNTELLNELTIVPPEATNLQLLIKALNKTSNLKPSDLRPEVLGRIARSYAAHYDVNPDDLEAIDDFIKEDADAAKELSERILSDLGFY
jgi:hypothetical protein